MAGLIPRGRRQPLWWTLHQPVRPLTYHTVHRMFERATGRAGSTATLHALRHTAAYRMAEDPALPLTDVQLVLGHAQLATTQIYLTPRAEDVIRRVLAHHAGQSRAASDLPVPALATGPRRWTCFSGRARDDRDCHSRSEPWWPGGAGDAGQDEAARVAVPFPGPARRGVLAGCWPGSRPGTGAGGISIGRAAGVPDPRQSPARPAGTAGLAGRAARPDLAATVAGQRRRCRRRAVGGRAWPGGYGAAACTRRRGWS